MINIFIWNILLHLVNFIMKLLNARCRFFFCEYLCIKIPNLTKNVIWPTMYVVWIGFVLIIGFGVTFEIVTDYSFRLVEQNFTDPITNTTTQHLVRKCLQTRSWFCRSNFEIVNNVFILLVEIIFLGLYFYLYLVPTMHVLVWLSGEKHIDKGC